jgi:hypothetical protein
MDTAELSDKTVADAREPWRTPRFKVHPAREAEIGPLAGADGSGHS